MVTAGMIGHNSRFARVTVEVRLFNALAAFNGNSREPVRVELPSGSTIGELAGRLGIPRDRIFLVLVNGRDVTPGRVGADVNGSRELEDGDVVAFSGPVPYSYGYGAAVV